ncbi:MAG: SH3 domain-containing protein [Acidobacteria bacterium]|nr:SH3 domain-containing protein [Acidobacteriota bacterium]
MKRILLFSLALVLGGCASEPVPEPAPSAPEAPPEPGTAAASPTPFVETVYTVSARRLNVRATASDKAALVVRVSGGQRVTALREEAGWLEIRTADGKAGWVQKKFLSKGDPCPPDRPFAVLEQPPLSFDSTGPRGRVVVEGNVSVAGVVTSTKVVSNSSGKPELAERAERELRAMKFAAPVKGCKPKAFVYTYARTF